jgi:hypothetical protein
MASRLIRVVVQVASTLNKIACKQRNATKILIRNSNAPCPERFSCNQILFMERLAMSLERMMVGVAGFEPAASCSQGTRANQAALHPVGRFYKSSTEKEQEIFTHKGYG